MAERSRMYEVPGERLRQMHAAEIECASLRVRLDAANAEIERMVAEGDAAGVDLRRPVIASPTESEAS